MLFEEKEEEKKPSESNYYLKKNKYFEEAKEKTESHANIHITSVNLIYLNCQENR